MREIEVPTKRRPLSPGEMMKEYLIDEELHLTQQQLAARLGISRGRVNEILNEKRAITADTAMRLERVLGPSTQFWMRLQLAVDLYDAKHSSAAAEINKLKPLRRGKSRKPAA